MERTGVEPVTSSMPWKAHSSGVFRISVPRLGDSVPMLTKVESFESKSTRMVTAIDDEVMIDDDIW